MPRCFVVGEDLKVRNMDTRSLSASPLPTSSRELWSTQLTLIDERVGARRIVDLHETRFE